MVKISIIRQSKLRLIFNYELITKVTCRSLAGVQNIVPQMEFSAISYVQSFSVFGNLDVPDVCTII